MNFYQFEELCRLFIAEKFGIPIQTVRSQRVHGPSRPTEKAVPHQVDLIWEVSDEVALYLNIANAKWRTGIKIDQPDVMLLEQVRNDLNAHKAFMITNTGFTEGAIAVAQQKRIALHILRPNFQAESLPKRDRQKIQETFLQLKKDGASSLYTYEVEHRDGSHLLGETADAFRPAQATGPAPQRVYETRVQAPPSNRQMGPGSNAGRGAPETRGGPPHGAQRRGSR